MTAVPSTQPVALVVEDEPIIMMETADLLVDRGFSVLEAYNAGEALERLAAHPNAVLMVTDVQMPGSLDGFELAREARVSFPALSIVVCSGRVRPGADDLPTNAVFVDKPLSAEVLAEALTQFEHLGWTTLPDV